MNRFAEAIEKGQIDVVPKINMSGGGAGGGNLIENLRSLLMTTKLGETVGVAASTARDPEVQAMRDALKAQMKKPEA